MGLDPVSGNIYASTFETGQESTIFVYDSQGNGLNQFTAGYFPSEFSFK